MNAMKKLAVVALVMAGLGGTALAAEAQPRAERRLERFDTNGDRTLDASEREAMKAKRQARRAELLAKYDANQDGTLDEAERAKAHAERSAERFKQLDTDGDGALSLEEFQAGMQAHGGGPHGRRGR